MNSVDLICWHTSQCHRKGECSNKQTRCRYFGKKKHRVIDDDDDDDVMKDKIYECADLCRNESVIRVDSIRVVFDVSSNSEIVVGPSNKYYLCPNIKSKMTLFLSQKEILQVN